MVVQIIILTLLFIVAFFYDAYIEDQVAKKWGECSSILEKMKQQSPKKHKNLIMMYGKEFDEIGHKTSEGFPISLYFNIKHLSRLNYFIYRFED